MPVGLFQGDAFKCQLYLDRVEELVIEGIEVLKVSSDEPIYICMGYIFSKARKTMEERCLNVMTTKIKGETQALAEREFIKSLAGMGIGDEASIAGMRSFNAFLSWVLEDLDNREHFVKTGWPAWSRLRVGRIS